MATKKRTEYDINEPQFNATNATQTMTIRFKDEDEAAAFPFPPLTFVDENGREYHTVRGVNGTYIIDGVHFARQGTLVFKE